MKKSAWFTPRVAGQKGLHPFFFFPLFEGFHFVFVFERRGRPEEEEKKNGVDFFPGGEAARTHRVRLGAGRHGRGQSP